MTRDGGQTYRFDRFILDADRHLLTDESGSAVDVTPKAVEILCMLVESSGKVVSKEELMRRVWSDSFVEEANLSHHIFKLRKALGETEGNKLIETVPKRGYRFVGELYDDPAPEPSDVVVVPPPRFTRLFPFLIGGALLATILVGVWFFYSRKATPTLLQTAAVETVRSIAVMPFVNESGNEDVEYLSDGMTDTLINSLSEVPSLHVKSRPTVFKYKGKDLPYSTLASELNVQALLFGRLTLRANELTLFLSLIDPETENQIWGKQYVRKLSDLVALQNEIGRDVAQSLEAKLTPATEKELAKNYSKNGEAYRLYLLGDYYWAKFTKENLLKAKKCYEDAIDIDQNYALAYTGLSNTYAVLGVNGHMSVAEARPLSRGAAEHAIQIDPRLPEAQLSMGAYKLFFEWDLNGAEEHFKRAMELNPDYAVPHELEAYVQRARGRHDEAIAEAARANELDPLNLLMLGDLAVCYRFSGQLQKALDTNARLIEMDQNFADARFENALLLAQMGKHDAALPEITKALELSGNSTHIKTGLGVVHASAGRTAQAQRVIDELVSDAKDRYVSPMDIALIYSVMGQKDKAFEWLEKAYDERTSWLFELNVTPELYPLKDDSRFHDLRQRLSL